MSHPSKPVLSDWQRAMAAGIAAAHPITPAVPVRARGVHLAADNDEPEAYGYLIDGTVYTLAQMLESNRDDEDICDWLSDAKPGDVWDGMSERVECVALPVFADEPEPADVVALPVLPMPTPNDRRALLLQVREMDCGVL